MAGIRGHNGSIKVFKAGSDTGIVKIVSAEVNQDSSFSRSQFVGKTIPEGDQTQDGWSGTMDLEVDGPDVDDLIDAMVTENLNGVGVDEVTIIMGESYPNGQRRDYVYFDMQVKMSKRQPNQTEKVTKRLEWQASGRLPL